MCGGRNRDRTCDPRLVRPMLSQLSYPPFFFNHKEIELIQKVTMSVKEKIKPMDGSDEIPAIAGG